MIECRTHIPDTLRDVTSREGPSVVRFHQAVALARGSLESHAIDDGDDSTAVPDKPERLTCAQHYPLAHSYCKLDDIASA